MPRGHLIVAAAALAALLAAARPAEAVRVTANNASGMAGQTVDVAITTTSLTGFDVRSLQFALTYNANHVTATDVLEAGHLTGVAGWGDATFGVTTTGGTGRITVSHAGTTALSGSGTLLQIRLVVNPEQLGATSAAMSFLNFTFNEGSPVDTTTNGTFTVNATPIITVSPNSGEVIRTQTLGFSVSGSVTPPVSWFTTDPAVATISAAGLLTGVAPGSVRVFAVDNAGRRDTTNDVVQVRGMGLTAGSASVVAGQTATVPLTVTSLDGLGVRAGQIRIAWSLAGLTATGMATPPGTLLHGYGPTAFGVAGNSCTVDFAGSTDLTGSGVLCHVTFATTTSNTYSLSLPVALFNETLPARVTTGAITVTPVPSITVQPENLTLFTGDSHPFTLAGSPTPPITWSTLDPAVATISSSGVLTAQGGGTTRVRAVDAVGAVDENTQVSVYDFAVSLPAVLAPPGVEVQIPLAVDRDVSPFLIRSLQYRVLHHATHITAADATPFGLVAPWGADGVVTHALPGDLRVAEAGTAPLAGAGPTLQVLEFTLSPTVPVGTVLPLTLTGFLCNEGRPRPLVTSGSIQVSTATDAGPSAAAGFALAAPHPNPASGASRLRFTIPRAGAGTLAVYGVDGRRVRTLRGGILAAGPHDLAWDGRDEAGVPAGPGLYFVRLDWEGASASRKLARVR